ncbi:M15 family metallopeptidase [Nocardioides jensenii]|uniref:M15 family metallopeptidase n=1 Tax=Nocardioides jensenii TaxID=1843 RepID=UPI00082CA701|nr:M15 family metallopeptidase [Nocardioides jensenii]
MKSRTPVRPGQRLVRSLLLTLVAVVAVVVLAVARPPFGDSQHDSAPGIFGIRADVPSLGGHDPRAGGPDRISLGEAGHVPDGVTVFDDGVPAVANLDPALLAALRSAADEADDDGVEFTVNSGWRSAAYQEQLLQDAVADYGSEAEAARWVATPETSAHVSGDAIDLGPPDSAGWLGDHGEDFGLCQIYRNEPWHFELRPDAVDDGCPDLYDDPTQDPRMQQ